MKIWNSHWKYTRMIKMYATLILAINFFVSCASHTSSYTHNSDIPSKFLNPYEIYAKELYIAAVGVGTTLKAARSAALSALAQQIEVSVKSSQRTEESFLISTAKGFSEDSALFGNTDVRSTGKFIGVQYAESFQHKDKNIYTIAYINRLSAAHTYRSRIDDATRTIHSLLEKSTVKEGLEKIAILLRAIALSAKNDAMLNQLDAISHPIAGLVRSNKRYTTPLLKNQLREIASHIVFAVPITVNLLYDAKLHLNAQEIEHHIKTSITHMLTSLQFRISEHELGHVFETEIHISQKTEKYPTLLWQLTVTIKDESNTIVLSKTHRGNAQGLTLAAAKRFALSDMQKIITTLFAVYIRNAFFVE